MGDAAGIGVAAGVEGRACERDMDVSADNAGTWDGAQGKLAGPARAGSLQHCSVPNVHLTARSGGGTPRRRPRPTLSLYLT